VKLIDDAAFQHFLSAVDAYSCALYGPSSDAERERLRRIREEAFGPALRVVQGMREERHKCDR
jgi:hypothetical protein